MLNRMSRSEFLGPISPRVEEPSGVPLLFSSHVRIMLSALDDFRLLAQ